MEKFTKWADKGTHINPFLPPRAASKGGLPARLISGLMGLTLFFIRLPFFIVALVLLELSILATFPPTWIVAGGALYLASENGLGPYQKAGGALVAGGLSLLVLRPIRRVVSVILVRTAVRFLLLVLGVSYVEQHANLRMLGLRPPGYKVPTAAVGSSVQAGDLLISNHTSLLDVLYLASRFLPLFTAFSVGPQVNFKSLSMLGAVWNASGVPRRELPKGKTLLELVAQARQEGRPLAVFPELARSNGEAVLAFVDGVFTDLDASTTPVRAHIFGFCSAETGSPLTCHTVGSAVWFVLSLMTRARTVIKVMHVSAEDAPVLSLRGETKGIVASLSRKGTGAWAEDLRSLLAQMISVKKLKVALGYEDFVTFDLYWRAVRSGDIATADRLAGARDKI